MRFRLTMLPSEVNPPGTRWFSTHFADQHARMPFPDRRTRRDGMCRLCVARRVEFGVDWGRIGHRLESGNTRLISSVPVRRVAREMMTSPRQHALVNTVDFKCVLRELNFFCASGEIGRRASLRGWWGNTRAGSNPVLRIPLNVRL